MKFSDFIVYSAIQSDLAATGKPEAIREMFTAIADVGGSPPPGSIVWLHRLGDSA